jgi:hypothetical protein
MSETENKLFIEYVPLKKLKKWPRNPKLHDGDGIAQSVDRFGFTDPILIDEKTGKMVAGHGRLEQIQLMKEEGADPPANIILKGEEWTIPVIRGNRFENENEVEAYLLTCNRLVENGGWDEELLEAMANMVNPIGFGEIIGKMEADIDQAIEDIMPDVAYPGGLMPTGIAGSDGVGEMKLSAEGLKKGETTAEDSRRKKTPDFDDIPGNLQGVFRMDEECIFTSSNELGIPDLLPDMILPEIPQPLKTWGGRRETPDDGESNYLFVYGTASGMECPWNRVLWACWSHDTHVKAVLEMPAYRAGQLLNGGVIGAVIPDVSLWRGNPLVLHMLAIYQAQWLGRFFQEAGVKIVPRFEYFLPECREFSLAGIPKNSPTLATQLHTDFTDESIPEIKKSLIERLGKIQPGQLLVYVSNRGANIIEDVRLELPVDEIIMVPTVKYVRRNQYSGTQSQESDPYLKQLRNKNKGGWKTKGGQDDQEADQE